MDNYYDYLSRFYSEVRMPGGYTFSHVNVLEQIERNYNSIFEKGDKDTRGFKKYFYNITKPACDIATKFIDLDTKDIILRHQLSDQEWKVWVMMHDLKGWLKKNKFGKLLNQIGMDYPKYGHVFVKKVKGKWHKLNIQNLRFDPSSSSLESDVWFDELHEMTAREISEMGWNKKEVDGLLATKKAKYIIYECYEYNYEGEKKFKRTFRSGLFRYQDAGTGSIVEGTEALMADRTRSFLPGIILYEDEVNNLTDIYRELKWEEVPGRRLGKGFVEYLFDNQIAENEAENLERKALHYTALHVFQTRDSTVGRNILTDVENGDILRADDPIVPIQNEERNLPAFNSTRQRWSINTVQKTFTTEISRGENLPSRTPLGVANLQASMIASYFDLKREDLGMFVADLIEDAILEFKKDQKAAHQVILHGGATGLEKFLKAIAKLQVAEKAVNYAMGPGKGFFPSEEERKREEEKLYLQMTEKKSIDLRVPDKMYDDIKYGLDIITTGEQVDVSQAIQSMQIATQLIASNPMILQNKGTRTMIFKGLELSGLSPIDLNLMEEAVTSEPQMAMPQGGSVGVPNQAQPMMGRMPQGV